MIDKRIIDLVRVTACSIRAVSILVLPLIVTALIIGGAVQLLGGCDLQSTHRQQKPTKTVSCIIAIMDLQSNINIPLKTVLIHTIIFHTFSSLVTFPCPSNGHFSTITCINQSIFWSKKTRQSSYYKVLLPVISLCSCLSQSKKCVAESRI